MHHLTRAARSRVVTGAIALLLGGAVAACGGGPSPVPSRSPVAGSPAATGAAGSAATAVPSSGASAPVDPSSTAERPVAFRSGSATLTLSGSESGTAELGEIVPSEDGSIFSGFDPVDGTTVSWREAQDGWYLTVSGFHGDGAIKTEDPSPFLSLTDPEQRNVQDMDGRCTVNVASSSREGFEGTIDCAGLQWHDEDGQPTGEPFGARVTFTATP
jgi:hypothetical protein